MTGLIRKATLLAACGVFIAAAAMAGVPSPGTSTFPTYIRLVGNAAGVPDTIDGRFQVIVRDVGGNPLNQQFVKADFSGCTADTKIASNQLNANYTTNCAAKTTGAYTDVTGTVYLTLLGNSFGAAVNGAGCMKLYAGTTLLSSVTANILDLDGVSGETTNDLSIGLADLGFHVYYGRTDYDENGSVTTNDLSVALGLLGGHHTSATGSPC
ncbi:MAG TPA: hypothetical protein VMH61_08035 [Candidatus Acidoferrales bacterium]|nr:hypothetical protein [Candidatus Acidoferrales bacterium]